MSPDARSRRRRRTDASAGWQGGKSWRSEFTEVQIDATNDGDGLTMLHVFIHWIRPIGEEDQQTGVLTVLNTELPRVADEMRRFLDLPHGHRFSTPRG